MVYVQEVLGFVNTLVIIPAYNEAGHIGQIIRSIKGMGLKVLVVDDGSTDDTAKAARDAGVVCLINLRNVGKGACLVKGFRYAIDNGFDSVITMDADGQHLTSDIPLFLQMAQLGSFFIVGNRMGEIRNMPATRLATNRFMSWLISQVTGQKIPDSQCGFRFMRTDVLERIKLNTAKYETESEILIKAARLKIKIDSVPIKTVYEGKKSQINPFVDTFRFIRFMIFGLWRK